VSETRTCAGCAYLPRKGSDELDGCCQRFKLSPEETRDTGLRVSWYVDAAPDRKACAYYSAKGRKPYEWEKGESGE